MKNAVEAKFHHVAIAVRDMDRMRDFYCDCMGFSIEWEKPAYSGEGFEKVVALKGANAHVAMLSGHGMHLELFHYFDPPGLDRGIPRMCDFGYTHFALTVKGLSGLYRQLVEADTVFNSPPQNLRPGVWAAYLQDPEGNTIELLQYEDV